MTYAVKFTSVVNGLKSLRILNCFVLLNSVHVNTFSMDLRVFLDQKQCPQLRAGQGVGDPQVL